MAQRLVPEGGWSHRLKPRRTPRIEKVSHRQFIKSLPCVCCAVERGDVAIRADDPLHIRGGSLIHGKEPAGGGRTSDDRWTLPGCRGHHDRQHACGDEAAFWRSFKIDHFLLALILWGLSGNEHEARAVILRHAMRARHIGAGLPKARKISTVGEGARRAAEA